MMDILKHFIKTGNKHSHLEHDEHGKNAVAPPRGIGNVVAVMKNIATNKPVYASEDAKARVKNVGQVFKAVATNKPVYAGQRQVLSPQPKIARAGIGAGIGSAGIAIGKAMATTGVIRPTPIAQKPSLARVGLAGVAVGKAIATTGVIKQKPTQTVGQIPTVFKTNTYSTIRPLPEVKSPIKLIESQEILKESLPKQKTLYPLSYSNRGIYVTPSGQGYSVGSDKWRSPESMGLEPPTPINQTNVQKWYHAQAEAQQSPALPGVTTIKQHLEQRKINNSEINKILATPVWKRTTLVGELPYESKYVGGLFPYYDKINAELSKTRQTPIGPPEVLPPQN